jgi:hypothetical protein
VIPTNDLTPMQAKALAILRDTFSTDGATKSEWQRACQDIAERTFHRVAKVLSERGMCGRSARTSVSPGGSREPRIYCQIVWQ